jgi:hypothetical protein
MWSTWASYISVTHKSAKDKVSVEETTRFSSELSTEKERMKIIDWLLPINFFLQHAEISRVRQKETGGWLLADPRFKRWESGSERMLWCPGIRA